MRRGELTADRSNVHDPAAALADHLRQGGNRRVQRRPEVDVHGALEVLVRHGLHGTDLDYSRVVDEDIDRAEVHLHGEYSVLDLLAVCYVTGDSEHVCPARF